MMGRHTIVTRVSPGLYDKIEARATKSGRSISAEVEMMLEQALLTEKLLSAISYMTITGKSANEIIKESADAA